MEKVNSFEFRLTYDGKDITKDVSKNLLDVGYTDKTHGESDELTVRMSDVDGLWRGPWYPGKGSKLTFEIGRGELTNFGTFDIDEIEISGPPSSVSIRALATGTSSSSRTAKNAGFENQTLKQIAEKVASANGWTIQGTINDVKFRRRTQRQETDLSFLKKLADESGNVFAVRDKVMFFSSRYELEGADIVGSIDITDVGGYSLRDDSIQTGFAKTKVEYYDPETDEVHRETVDFEDSGIDGDPNADELICRERVESKQHAEIKAKSMMYNTARKQISVNLSGIMGRAWMLAGNNVALTGFGEMSGVFHIENSNHKVSRSAGWDVSLELKRIKYPTDTMKEPKKLRIKQDELITFSR